MKKRTVTDQEAIEKIIMELAYAIKPVPNPFEKAWIKHPILEYREMVHENKNGELYSVDMCHATDKEFVEGINRMKQGNFALWFHFGINDPYRFAFLKQVAPYYSAGDLGVIVRTLWHKVENPAEDPSFSIAELCQLFRDCDPETLMKSSERNVIKKMPEIVHVYRATYSTEMPNILSVSWTLKPHIAEQDALKYGRNGLVYEADIPRKDILAYYGRSGKAEVVLDPTNIQNIEVRDESKWSVLSPAHAVRMVENAVKKIMG